MIILVTNRRDVTTDFVVRALRQRDVAFCRLNTEDLLRSWKISWQPSGWEAADARGRVLRSADITGAYYRRPLAPNPIDGTADEAGAFVTRETRALLRGLIAHTHCPWISDPTAIELAEDKLFQLRTASTLGFHIPRTLVTNIPAEANAFVSSVGSAIVKPLSSGHLSDDPPRLVYTSPLSTESDLNSVAFAPHLLQECILKTADIRVTVVDRQVFACRIASQKYPETALDWRRASNEDLTLDYTLIDLPQSVEGACVSLVQALGLRFGAIDLVERAGGFTFLEINPNGQWAWIEQRTTAPISVALATALIGTNDGVPSTAHRTSAV